MARFESSFFQTWKILNALWPDMAVETYPTPAKTTSAANVEFAIKDKTSVWAIFFISTALRCPQSALSVRLVTSIDRNEQYCQGESIPRMDTAKP